MAEIAARPSNPGVGASGITLFSWTTLTEADTTEEIRVNGTGPIACALQVTGTFGGATVTLEGSNDGTTWATLADVQGEVAGITAAGIAEYSTSVVYLRVVATSGTAQDLDIYLSFRG